jgi:hypothetical protein
MARLAFAAVWVIAQLALIVTAASRPDGAFGFRMFPESSTIAVQLARVVPDRDLPVDVQGGVWIARDRQGRAHRFSWADYDADGARVLGYTVVASYGAAAQLARWQAALDYVARRLDGDAETQELIADVTVRQNLRPAWLVRLHSPVGRR